MDFENNKNESSINDNGKKNYTEINTNKIYISLDNNFKKNHFRHINKKYNSNKNKSPTSNNPPYSTLDSSLNISTMYNNTLNKSLIYKEIIKTIPNLNSNKKTNINRLKDSKYTFEELNRKFNSLKVDHRRRERSLTGKINLKYKINKNYNKNNIKRAISFSKLKCNTYSLDINKGYLNEINNNFYYQTQNSKNKNYFYNKSKKNDFLRLKINSMINNFDKESKPNKKPVVNSFKYGKYYKKFYNYNKSKPKELNFISNTENDIKKLNIFAKSKLMDINDIKNINTKNNFFDYNYNRNYSKRFINNNLNQSKNKNNLNQLIEYLK